jgi:hypothetical protein
VADRPDEGLLETIYAPPPALKPWKLDELLPGMDVRYYSFGRRALAAGLKAAGIGPGARVLLPGFLCRDLLSSLAVLGAEPAFYPVGLDLRPSEGPERWPAAAAVLAVDYFGFPQDLAPFKAYARKTGALVIEDNAHGLFSRDAEGALLGTRADLGLFSLRKTLPIPDGGALALRKGDARMKLPEQGRFRGSEDLRPRLKAALRPLARTLGARGFYSALSAFRGLRALGSGDRIPPPDPASESILPSPEAPCALLAGPITAAGPDTEVSRRRELYFHFSRLLRSEGFTPVFDSLPKGAAPYAFPFRMKASDRARCFRLLAAQGLEPLPWPDMPSALAAAAPEHHRNLWLAHFLW